MVGFEIELVSFWSTFVDIFLKICSWRYFVVTLDDDDPTSKFIILTKLYPTSKMNMTSMYANISSCSLIFLWRVKEKVAQADLELKKRWTYVHHPASKQVTTKYLQTRIFKKYQQKWTEMTLESNSRILQYVAPPMSSLAQRGQISNLRFVKPWFQFV